MKKNLFLLILFSCIIISAMEQDHEDQFSEQWKVIKSIQYDDSIKNVNFNAKDKQLLVCDYGEVFGPPKSRAILWNLDDQKVILKHDSGCWKPRFSPDNQYIITAPCSDEIALSDIKGNEIMKIKTNSHNELVKFNTKSNQILTVGEGRVGLWDIENNKQLAEFLRGYCVNIAKFFPHDERLIFIAYHAHHNAKIWDTRSKEFIECKYIDPLSKADIHPEGNYLACINHNDHNVAYMHDLRAKSETWLTDGNHFLSAKFNSAGTYILTNFDCAYVRLWNTQVVKQYLNKGRCPKSAITLKRANLYSGKFHPKDANNILTHSTKTIFSPENSISIWDIHGKELATLPDEKKLIGAKFDATGNYIISKHEDNKDYIVRLWKKVGCKNE